MRRKRALGFTLLELAVVIFLISIFMGLGLSALDVQQTNRAYSETREKQEKIKDALVFHLANFRRLPCPDADPIGGAPPDGLEDRIGGAPTIPTNPCVAVAGFGVIPYLTLGLSRDDALDGWDNFLSYQVSLDNGGTPANEEWSLSPPFSGGFAVGNEGSIGLNDRNPTTGAPITLNGPPPQPDPPPTLGVPRGIAAIIVSHGRNGSGAFTTKGTQNQPPLAVLADEFDNTNTDSDFFRREFTDVDVLNGGPFDDLVLALTPTDLLTPAIKDGALPSAAAQARSQVKAIVDTAFGRVPVNTCQPPDSAPSPPAGFFGTLPADIRVDPWGQFINYIRADPGPLTPTSPDDDTVAFCAWSSGPDRTTTAVCGPLFALTGDDVGLPPVTYDQLRTAFSSGTPPSPCPLPP